jgi:hypothetical protein
MVVMTDVYEYYLHTGDIAFVEQHWPAITRQMDWNAQQVGPNGLFVVDSSNNADWNIESISGELTYVNAIYYQALLAAAKLADAVGDTASRDAWTSAAASIKAAVDAHLWNPSTGVYDASTEIRGAIVQDANTLAVLSGLADPERAKSITHTLATSLDSQYGALTVASPVPTGYNQLVSPYMGSLQLLATLQTGNTADALALTRKEWGYMLGQDPGGVFWEKIPATGVPGTLDSAAHAWATGPSSALPRFILGGAPASPGYASWTVRPQPGDLEWAQGIVPTPLGDLTVRWQRGESDSSQFQLTVIVPAGSSGNVAVPLINNAKTVAVDGELIWADGKAVNGSEAQLIDGAVVVPVSKGQYTFASM